VEKMWKTGNLDSGKENNLVKGGTAAEKGNLTKKSPG